MREKYSRKCVGDSCLEGGGALRLRVISPRFVREAWRCRYELCLIISRMRGECLGEILVEGQ